MSRNPFCRYLVPLVGIVVATCTYADGPIDPFAGATPEFEAAAPEATNLNLGDWGVSTQVGAATYTFPIEVPPGRRGMQPELALRYSSDAALRGGVAVGWVLDLPT